MICRPALQLPRRTPLSAGGGSLPVLTAVDPCVQALKVSLKVLLDKPSATGLGARPSMIGRARHNPHLYCNLPQVASTTLNQEAEA